MNKQTLKAIQYNRRHNEFLEDNGCVHCDFFDKCVCNIGKEKFTCPLNNPKSQFYKSWMASNFKDLTDVLVEPSLQDWKEICVGSDRQIKYNLDKLNYVVTMPKCEAFEEFQKKTSISSTKTHITCLFNARQLRQRLRAILIYKPEGYTTYNDIANQLIEILIPIDYQYLFNFTKDNKGDTND